MRRNDRIEKERRENQQMLLREREIGVFGFIKHVRDRANSLRRQYPHLSSAAVLSEAFETEATLSSVPASRPPTVEEAEADPARILTTDEGMPIGSANDPSSTRFP